MTTPTEIANRALLLLGESALLSIDDDTEAGRACRIAYDPARRATLRAHPWNFAIKRAVLAPLSEAPTYQYDYAYAVPGDCLRILRDRDSPGWALESGNILTDAGPALNLRYVYDCQDPTRFDALFVDALVAALAVRLAEKITQSTSKQQLARESYREAIMEARRNDAQENPPAEPPVEDWLLARY